MDDSTSTFARLCRRALLKGCGTAAAGAICVELQRPNRVQHDTDKLTRGRAMKLTHYIDLHKRLYGVMPDDIHLFVRNKADVPITMKDDLLKILKEKQWKERRIPDPTLLPRLVRKRKGD